MKKESIYELYGLKLHFNINFDTEGINFEYTGYFDDIVAHNRSLEVIKDVLLRNFEKQMIDYGIQIITITIENGNGNVNGTYNNDRYHIFSCRKGNLIRLKSIIKEKINSILNLWKTLLMLEYKNCVVVYNNKEIMFNVWLNFIKNININPEIVDVKKLLINFDFGETQDFSYF